MCISKIEVDEKRSKDDSNEAETDHGQIHPNIQLHQLIFDDSSVLRNFGPYPDDLVHTVGVWRGVVGVHRS